MTSREVIFGLAGAAIGAVTAYFVMERIHEKEVTELLEEIDSAERTFRDIADVADTIMVDGLPFDMAMGVENHALIEQEFEAVLEEDRPNRIDIPGGGTVHLRMATDDEVEPDNYVEYDKIASDPDEETDEPEDEGVIPMPEYDGIYIIQNHEVSGRQVVGVYDHDTGSVEIAKMMSVPAESLDDIIENDMLYSLINEEAYDLLMNSEVEQEPRIVCVRNNVLNLDFVITY